MSSLTRLKAGLKPSLQDLRPIPRSTSSGTSSLSDSEAKTADASDCVEHPPFRAPRWIRDMIASKAGFTEIVDTLRERLLRGESDLHEAQRILNHIGLRPGGGAVLKRAVTQDFIKRLSRGG